MKECSAVVEAIRWFKSYEDSGKSLRHLCEPDWKMFGRAIQVFNGEINTVELLHMTGMSKAEAKKLAGNNTVYKTALDEAHYVLTNKTGSILYGLFRNRI